MAVGRWDIEHYECRTGHPPALYGNQFAISYMLAACFWFGLGKRFCCGDKQVCVRARVPTHTGLERQVTWIWFTSMRLVWRLTIVTVVGNFVTVVVLVHKCAVSFETYYSEQCLVIL